jgi:hypothetical protein
MQGIKLRSTRGSIVILQCSRFCVAQATNRNGSPGNKKKDF